MNKKTDRLVKAKPKDAIGSGLVCHLNAAYSDLAEKLGRPHDRTQEGKWKSSDGKTRIEWAFKIESKKRPTVITVYDYKERQPVEEIVRWHVGAKGDMWAAYRFLKNLFSEEAIEIMTQRPKQ